MTQTVWLLTVTAVDNPEDDGGDLSADDPIIQTSAYADRDTALLAAERELETMLAEAREEAEKTGGSFDLTRSVRTTDGRPFYVELTDRFSITRLEVFRLEVLDELEAVLGA